MTFAQARIADLVDRSGRVAVDPRRSELDDIGRLSEDEVTALLRRRFARFLDAGCDCEQAVRLAVGLV